MDKRNPKGRKLDKNGNPIVTMDAVKKAGFTNLRDYLNDKRGLKRRDGKAPERTKEYIAKNMTAPIIAPAVEANPMGDAALEEKYGSGLKMGGKVKGYKSGGSPGMHRMPDGKMMKDSAHKKHGGKVKGYAPGGSVGRGYGKARGAKACKMS
jgi:hypothetical protein